jgi:hypothetical protein
MSNFKLNRPLLNGTFSGYPMPVRARETLLFLEFWSNNGQTQRSIFLATFGPAALIALAPTKAAARRVSDQPLMVVAVL